MEEVEDLSHKVPASDECKDNLTRHDRVRDFEFINFQQFQQESKNLEFGKSLVALPGRSLSRPSTQALEPQILQVS